MFGVRAIFAPIRAFDWHAWLLPRVKTDVAGLVVGRFIIVIAWFAFLGGHGWRRREGAGGGGSVEVMAAATDGGGGDGDDSN